jgi:hypothetical protein
MLCSPMSVNQLGNNSDTQVYISSMCRKILIL